MPSSPEVNQSDSLAVSNRSAADEMVERVARALWGVSDFNEKSWPWEECGSSQKAGYRLHARAAIEAMREPTDAMFDAGEKAATTYSARWMMSIADDVWTAMVDAALNGLAK